MYDYYLITTQNFSIVDLSKFASDKGHGIYTESETNFDEMKKLGFGFANAGSALWQLMQKKLIAEKTFLLINIDRPL